MQLNPAEALSSHRHHQAESAVKSKLTHDTLPDPNLGEARFFSSAITYKEFPLY